MKNLLPNILWSALLLATSSAFAQDLNIQLRSTMEFPGQTLANICGYTQAGREYALVGGSNGMIIVDITNPEVPVKILQLPAPEGLPNSSSLWKEIKVYQHYAYLTTEAGGGVQIVDLSALPSPNLNFKLYTGDGAFANQVDEIHALHIDVTKGFLYIYGGSPVSNAARVFDIHTDPYNPVYVGKFDQLGYIHDGYADNDTLYACHIYTGLLSITDMTDKANPKLLGTVQTPGKFTHNSWLLDDHNYILTTDEAVPSFVTAYDISDPTDIKELDRVSTNDGNGSIGHNTHVRDNWAITSWYTDGVVIIDAHKPDNLVIVGRYDTWAPPFAGDFFEGCWGAYPFFPSGTIVTSNIEPAVLTVLTPTYKRAAYLEGTIMNGCTGLPMNGATITVNSPDSGINTTTNNFGIFKTGQATEGTFLVTVSKNGFTPQTEMVSLVAGQVTNLNLTLAPSAVFNVNATIINAATQQPIGLTTVTLTSALSTYTLQTNAAGQVNITCDPGGNFSVGTWGYLVSSFNVSASGNAVISLTPGYYDDFQLDLGWTNSTTASSGAWVRGEPIGTSNNNNLANPEVDSPNDNNDLCYITGNGGGGAGADDVDNGDVTLTSPVMHLAGYQDAILSFDYWFFNGGGSGNANDRFEVRAISNGQTVTLLTEAVSASQWRSSGDIHLKDFITLSANVQVQFYAIDETPGHVVEAAVDVVKVTPTGLIGIPDLDASASLLVVPNPTSTDFSLQYAWPTVPNLVLEVRNLLGQVVYTQALGSDTGSVRFGQNWPVGIYLATLRSDSRQSMPVKMVKQ